MARNKTLVQNHDEEGEFSEEELHGSKTMAARSTGRVHGDRKRRRSIFIDDVAEEADDDSEEEDNDDDFDEEDYYGKGKRKRRPNSAARFIDDQATVATDDDESTDGELGGESFIVSNEEIVQDDAERRMGHGHQPHWSDDEQENIEEFERRIYQRYNNLHDKEIDEAETNDVEQRSLLPSVSDTKLWTVKCAIGREREAALCLMQKCIDRAPGMNITSAIALDYLQNYIYVEAHKESHVREACKSLRMLDTRGIRLVPIKEMTDVVSEKGKAIDIVKDMWVRMKIGIYKGDIARVVSEPDMRRHVMVQLTIITNGDYQMMK